MRCLQGTEAMARFDHCIEPMTLANMRQLGARSLAVSCWLRHHQAVLSADPWPDEIPVPTFGRAWCQCAAELADHCL